MDRNLAHRFIGLDLGRLDPELGDRRVFLRPHRETRQDLGLPTYRIPILIGAILLTPWTSRVLGEKPLWDVGTTGTYVFAALTAAGCLFTWWARIHLGRFWSNAITRKEGHRVIDTGPYGLVRHPIYTGLIGAMIATGIAVGTATALLGTVLIAFGLWQKARMEEGFLSAELGADAYGPYCQRVPMLVPFLPQR